MYEISRQKAVATRQDDYNLFARQGNPNGL